MYDFCPVLPKETLVILFTTAILQIEEMARTESNGRMELSLRDISLSVICHAAIRGQTMGETQQSPDPYLRELKKNTSLLLVCSHRELINSKLS